MAKILDTLTVAAINLEISGAKGLEGVVAIARDAAERGAKLIVLPECAILELLGSHSELPEEETPGCLAPLAEEWIAAFSSLSRESGAVIVAGTVFEACDRGFANCCPIMFPDGSVHRIVKNRLTTYEREVWKLQSGDRLRVFAHPPFGVAICYDAEFPEACRAMAEAGAKIICVPSYTESRRGFQRVRWSCLARAVENQVFVIQTSLVGGLGREPVLGGYGASAVIAPSIEPFPESAILAETELNRQGKAVATLYFGQLEEARRSGSVRNWNDREPMVWKVEREAL